MPWMYPKLATKIPSRDYWPRSAVSMATSEYDLFIAIVHLLLIYIVSLEKQQTWNWVTAAYLSSPLSDVYLLV